MKPENIKTIIDIAEYLKLKEKQSIWDKINELENEYISEDERKYIKELKLSSDFINQDDLLKELGINADEINSSGARETSEKLKPAYKS